MIVSAYFSLFLDFSLSTIGFNRCIFRSVSGDFLNWKDSGFSSAGSVLIVVIVLIILGGSFYVFSGPESNFRVENISLNPEEVPEGEPIRVEADVKNIGGAEGTHTVKVQVDGETFEDEITLAGGESKAVQFDVVKHVEGTYNLSLENSTESFRVIDPAEFEVDNLSVDPSEVEPGNSVIVFADVVNKGGLTGSYSLELKVDGVLEEGDTVELDPGESVSVSFEVVRNVSDSYEVSLGGLTDSFYVVENET